jgi:hypothetical protein
MPSSAEAGVADAEALAPIAPIANVRPTQPRPITSTLENRPSIACGLPLVGLLLTLGYRDDLGNGF